jgi:galactokinase
MAKRAFWAPGRVNLIGEYTDLVGGLVLPAALDLGIRVEVSPAARISLRSDTFGEDAVAAADGGEFSGSGWARYVAAVAQELALLGRPAVGIQGAITSTVPVGAGLSSSAALEVAVAVALCRVADFELDPMPLAQAAQRAEVRAVGVPCGIMDQAAAVLGRAGCALLLDTGSLEHEAVELPEDIAIVVIDSGVSRSLESSQYALRKDELEQALSGAGDPDDPLLARRRRHVETENARVRDVVEALRANRVAALADLFREGHESLRNDLEVTIPELDRLVELAYASGALAARMTGAGFGGAVVALAPSGEASEVAARIVAGYGPRGRSYVCRASDGARELG